MSAVAAAHGLSLSGRELAILCQKVENLVSACTGVGWGGRHLLRMLSRANLPLTTCRWAHNALLRMRASALHGGTDRPVTTPKAMRQSVTLLCMFQVVGAPCGVMDQMTSSLGHAGKLLALLCQPAEVLGHVTIPPQLRFWGIDSGIRHAVSGADYGTVRVGAFMGLSSMAGTALSGGWLVVPALRIRVWLWAGGVRTAAQRSAGSESTRPIRAHAICGSSA